MYCYCVLLCWLLCFKHGSCLNILIMKSLFLASWFSGTKFIKQPPVRVQSRWQRREWTCGNSMTYLDTVCTSGCRPQSSWRETTFLFMEGSSKGVQNNRHLRDRQGARKRLRTQEENTLGAIEATLLVLPHQPIWSAEGALPLSPLSMVDKWVCLLDSDYGYSEYSMECHDISHRWC